MLAEGFPIRLVDFDAFGLDEGRQIGFFLELTQTAVSSSRISSTLHGQLLIRGEIVPNLLRERNVVQVNKMRRKHDLFRDFVELSIDNGRQRIVLPIDRTRCKRSVHFGESQRSRRGTKGFAQELPSIRTGHAEIDAFQISWRTHGKLAFGLTQIHMPTTKIHHRKQFHAKLIFSFFLEIIHQRVVEHSHLMRRILMDITGCKD